MELYNAKTRKREEINDQEALHNAILSGSHSYKSGSFVPVINPQGDDKEIAAESVAEAIQAGYKIKTGMQNRVEEVAHRPENSGWKGAAKVLGGQAVDETLMGIPEIVADSTQDQFDVALREYMKKKHDIANAAGGTAGFIASLFVGGPLWKAAAKGGAKTSALLAEKIVAKSGGEVSKSAARRMARGIVESTAPKAAGGAVEGLIASSPLAITEAALGDAEGAAEALFAGIGLGGLFGGVAGAGGALGSKFKNVAKDTKVAKELRSHYDDLMRTGSAENNKFRDMASDKAFEALDPKKHHIKKFSANEIVEDEFGNAISVSRSKDKKAIGRTLIDEGIFDGFPPKIDEIAERISTKVQKYHDDVLDTFNKLDADYPQAKVSTVEIADTIRKKVIPQLKKNTAIHREVKRLEKELDVLAESNGLLTLTQANSLKANYQAQIGDLALTESKSFKNLLNEVPKEFNRQIRKTIGEIDKKTLDDLVRMQTTFGNLRAAEKIAIDRAEAATANNDLGLTSFISGVGGAAMFDGGITSVIAGLAAGGGREFTRRRGDVLLSKGYDKIGGILFAEQAMKHSGKQLNRIPEILGDMARGVKEGTARGRSASIPAIIRLFGEETVKTKAAASNPPARQGSPFRTIPMPAPKKRLKKLKDELGPLVQDPQMMLDRIAEVTEPIIEGGAPQTGSALSARMAQVAQYIDAIMPKPPRPNSPFAPQIEWEPSDYEMAAFDQKLSVIMDPFVVLDELEAGTLTRNHMESLKTIYPVIHAAMQAKVQEAVVNGAEPVPYKERVKLSLLMDAPMDPSLEKRAIATFQQSFAGMTEDGEPEGMPAQPQGISVNLADGLASPGQRLLGG